MALSVACCTCRDRGDEDIEPAIPLQPTDKNGQERFSRRTDKDFLRKRELSQQTLQKHLDAEAGQRTLLVYSVMDVGLNTRPNQGDHGPPQPYPRARRVPQNSPMPVPIETSGFVGEALWLQRTDEKIPSDYAMHFQRRRRNWEFRVQGRFKRVPKGALYVGIVLRDFNYNQAVARTSMVVKKAGLRLVPFESYMSWGDRCQAAEAPDAEFSHLVTDMAGWDQIIVTPAGQKPPMLIGELKGLGLEREAQGLGVYSFDVRRTVRDINTNDTYTFCFWGCSRIVDMVQWQFNFTAMRIDMGNFFQEWPMHGVMYELDPTQLTEKDSRHLEHRKRYYLDLLFWNNNVKISEDLVERYCFQDAPPECLKRPSNLMTEKTDEEVTGAIVPRLSRGGSMLMPSWLSRIVCGGVASPHAADSNIEPDGRRSSWPAAA